jgi:ribosomal-protein-alanine N-acetyltransferase
MLKKIFDKSIMITTDHLVLRPIVRADAEDIFEIFSDRQVMKYYDLLPFETIERAKEQIEFFISGFEQKTMLRWGIELKDSGKLIGTCGFFNFNDDALKAELGYELNSSYQGKGYMTQALNAILTYIFRETDINRVEAFVEPPNLASQKTLEKLGFTKEGTLRSYERCRGDLIDITVYSCLRADGKY